MMIIIAIGIIIAIISSIATPLLLLLIITLQMHSRLLRLTALMQESLLTGKSVISQS